MRQLLARIMDRTQRRIQPDGEKGLSREPGLHRAGSCRSAVAGKAFTGARQHPGERHGSAAESVDGHVGGAGDLRGSIKAGEGL